MPALLSGGLAGLVSDSSSIPRSSNRRFAHFHQWSTTWVSDAMVRRRGQPLKPKRSPRVAAFIRSEHQELYHTDDTPIATFGYPNFEAVSAFYKIDWSHRIGAGTFGVVHKASHKQTGEQFAIKKMPKRFNPDGATLDKYYTRRIRNEVDIGAHLGPSLNVAYLYGAYEDKDSVYLLMELCTGGELWDKIKLGSYGEKDAARLVTEILRTVAQCHAAGVLIRDIKPENFLFASDLPDATLKAIDFGISVFCEAGQYVDMRAGTPIYIAPEVLKMKYTQSADIWSVGIVAYQLLTGRLPFSGEEGEDVAEAFMSGEKVDNKEVFRAVLYAELDFTSPPWDVLSPAAKELISSLLNRDETKRPTAEEALKHPWLVESQHTGDHVPLADTIVQRLQRFGTYGRLRQAALKKIALAAAEINGQDDEDLSSKLRRLSETLPVLEGSVTSLVRPDGRVEVALLRRVLEGGHFKLSPAEADQLLAQVHEEDGAMDYAEWVTAMADWSSIRSSADWDSIVAEAFKTLDRGSQGMLSATDLEALLCGDKGCDDPFVVGDALREADTDHDGGINLEEFKALVSDQHEASLDLFDPRLAGESSSEEFGLTS